MKIKKIVSKNLRMVNREERYLFDCLESYFWRIKKKWCLYFITKYSKK